MYQSKQVYYKIDLDKITQEWLDNSKCDSIRTCVTSKTISNKTYIILTFDHHDVPMSLFSSKRAEEMTQEEALAELAGSVWQI